MGIRGAVAIGLADVEWGSIDIAGPALRGAPARPCRQLRGSPYATRFRGVTRSFALPPEHRYRRTRTGCRAVRPRLVARLACAIVYVSFGTVLGHMSIAADAFRAVAHAVAESMPECFSRSVGRSTGHSSGVLPANVHVEPWVDQADAIAEAQVVVSHGGSGTTFGALRAGVPVVIVPLFADQFIERVAGGRRRSRCGGRPGRGRRRPPAPAQRADTPRITAAIESVRNDPTCRDGARRIAAEMAATPTVEAVFDELTSG